MKIPLELNVVRGGAFLNFWNSDNGDDVVCFVRGDGTLILNRYVVKDKSEPDGLRLEEKPITLKEFIRRVKKSAKRSEARR